MRTVDRQWVEMKDLEFYPVTLCSRWRSGQAWPGLSQEKERENEWKRGDGWVEGRRVRDRAVVFVFICLFNLQEYMCFLFFDGLLWVVYGPPSSFHSFPHPFFSIPPSCPAEAPPEPSHRGSDPSWPTAKRKEADRGQRREKGDSIEGREISEQDQAAGTL